MQLTFLILVLCCYIQKSNPIPPPHPESSWRPSRYIIDNRRNALFSKKPFSALVQQAQEDSPRESTGFRFNSNSLKPKLFSVERYQKDLTAEASIAGPKFYRKYGENGLPRKVVKSFKLNEGSGSPDVFKYNDELIERQKNATGILDPQNFIQGEDEILNEVTSKTAATTEKVQSWVPKIDEDVLISGTSSTSRATTTLKDGQTSQPNEGFEFGSPTTKSFPWKLTNTKTEEGNQIDNPNEKHVYETRIETVSYHQEVIFNPAKKQKWFPGELKPERGNYEPPEENYEEQEKSYETPEENYEEQEKSYETPEENYEEPEKNYELDNVMPGRGVHPADNEENQNKFGYVVEGENYRKYRVEERTVDGFIVGEYGVVSHDDGSLRGVRYTAEGSTNPQLIYETLIKFLSL